MKQEIKNRYISYATTCRRRIEALRHQRAYQIARHDVRGRADINQQIEEQKKSLKDLIQWFKEGVEIF